MKIRGKDIWDKRGHIMALFLVNVISAGPVKKERLWLYQPSRESGVFMALSATGN